MSAAASHKIDPQTEGQWLRELARHGHTIVTYRGRRIAYPHGACALAGGALDHAQVPCVTELVLGTLLRDVLARQGVVGWPQHVRSITTAARMAPAYVERIEQNLSFTIDEAELVDALATYSPTH